jgi:hypothetical protein
MVSGEFNHRPTINAHGEKRLSRDRLLRRDRIGHAHSRGFDLLRDRLRSLAPLPPEATSKGGPGSGAFRELADNALGDIAHGIKSADHLLFADKDIVEQAFKLRRHARIDQAGSACLRTPNSERPVSVGTISFLGQSKNPASCTMQTAWVLIHGLVLNPLEPSHPWVAGVLAVQSITVSFRRIVDARVRDSQLPIQGRALRLRSPFGIPQTAPS